MSPICISYKYTSIVATMDASMGREGGTNYEIMFEHNKVHNLRAGGGVGDESASLHPMLLVSLEQMLQYVFGS